MGRGREHRTHGHVSYCLAGETGTTLLRIALTRWIEDPAERPWEVHVREAMDELRGLIAPPGVAAPAR